MSKTRITIKDLARELHVSTSTISRALADRWDVSPDTRKAVVELAERLNYKPNPISLSLKQKQSKAIGVMVPEFINSFFAEIIMGIQGVMEANGFHILVCQSNESYQKEVDNLKILESSMVDGYIVSVTKETKNAKHFARMIENDVPLVFFNRVCEDVSASNVTIDDYKWAFQAVEHLIDQGCKRIVHLMGPENLLLANKRKQAWEDALRKHGLEASSDLLIPAGLMMEMGVIATHTIMEMKNPPDGIFAVNDPVAIGAMKTLLKNGYRIPEDIAVVGFSESPSALIVEPNLTSVEQPTFEIGKIAAELLLEQINYQGDIGAPVKSITLDARLNIRESSLKNQ
jgi:LacI family transcriptional regulator